MDVRISKKNIEKRCKELDNKIEDKTKKLLDYVERDIFLYCLVALKQK